MSPSRRLRLLAAALLAAAPALSAQPGRLVIVGGGLSDTNAVVYRAILDGRKGTGPFCIIPTAGATPETAMDGPARNFDKYAGAGAARGVLISSKRPETAHDPAVVAQLRACSGFYFIGGVQSRVTAAFRPDGRATPAYEAVMQRWREGAVVSGSSAGAAIMSDPMIAGGTSAGAFTRGLVRLEGAAADADSTAGMIMSGGLGFYPAALADQHFLARGRFGRLLVALLELPTFDLAFGIDENTALVVDGPRLEAVGASAITVFDTRSATRDGRAMRNITMHLMGPGDRFDSRTRSYTAGDGKRTVAVQTDTIVSVANIFAPWAFLRALDAFAASAQSTVTWNVPQGVITVRRDSGFRAVRRDGTGVQGAAAALGMTGLRIDVTRSAAPSSGAR